MRTLSAKIIAVHVLFLAIALMSIGVTLLVSWELEGGAAAINDAGSLRMRAYRMAFVLADGKGLSTPTERAETAADLAAFETVLATLRQGDPARPLFLPVDTRVSELFTDMEKRWQGLNAIATRAVAGEPASIPRDDVAAFVTATNALVSRIEHDLARTTSQLYMFQMGLVALAIAGTIAIVYLAFLVIIGPLQRLREGMERMAAADFSVRLAPGGRDEFGQLAEGFNTMADRLRDLYENLESRVREKTRSLGERNQELTALYDTGAFLAEPRAMDALCSGFLQRVATSLGADAGAIRLIGSDPPQLHVVAAYKLPEGFASDEACVAIGECACACGAAASTEKTIHWGDRASSGTPYPPCHKHGLLAMTAVPVRTQTETIGVLNLFFLDSHEFEPRVRQLLESLARQLGTAIENQRLISREKEMAVSEERNLLAQELHDSIAQSLAFLNLQVQMLGGAMKRADETAMETAVGEIGVGVRECTADVRELLVHFRTRSSHEDIAAALKLTLHKFEQQSGICAMFTESGRALPVPADAQVQILHVVQEALSNVRKHSGASEVRVSMLRGPEYVFEVRDNGCGFEVKDDASNLHVGLSIMHERASRAGAALEVRSSRGSGTTVRLCVPVTLALAEAA